MGKKKDKEELKRAEDVLKEEPELKKTRMPDMKRFQYTGIARYPNMAIQFFFSFLATIGIFTMIFGFYLEGIGEKIIAFTIAFLLFIPTPLFIIYIFWYTKKLGNGKYAVNTNFYLHDEKGIYFTRHLDQGKFATFIPWNHIKKIEFSKGWNMICIVPDTMFKVTKNNCKPSNINCVILSLKNEKVRELVLDIYENKVPVMSGEKMVYRSDMIKIHGYE